MLGAAGRSCESLRKYAMVTSYRTVFWASMLCTQQQKPLVRGVRTCSVGGYPEKTKFFKKKKQERKTKEVHKNWKQEYARHPPRSLANSTFCIIAGRLLTSKRVPSGKSTSQTWKKGAKNEKKNPPPTRRDSFHSFPSPSPPCLFSYTPHLSITSLIIVDCFCNSLLILVPAFGNIDAAVL